jgi:hypothetical protein
MLKSQDMRVVRRDEPGVDVSNMPAMPSMISDARRPVTR